MIEKFEGQFTKYEIARILGARALQIAMDAPLLLKIDEKELENIHYNPIEIAKREFAAGVLPITVNRPMPKKKEGKLKAISREEIVLLKKKEKKIKEQKEKKAEKEIEEETGKPAPIHAAEIKEDAELEHEEELEEKKIAEDAEIMEMAIPEDEEEAIEAPIEEEY